MKRYKLRARPWDIAFLEETLDPEGEWVKYSELREDKECNCEYYAYKSDDDWWVCPMHGYIRR